MEYFLADSKFQESVDATFEPVIRLLIERVLFNLRLMIYQHYGQEPHTRQQTNQRHPNPWTMPRSVPCIRAQVHFLQFDSSCFSP